MASQHYTTNQPRRTAAQTRNGAMAEIKMTQEELDQILSAHRKWLATLGEEGRRADLWDANLEGANLQEPTWGAPN